MLCFYCIAWPKLTQTFIEQSSQCVSGWSETFLFFFFLAPGESDSCLVDMLKFCIRGLFFMLSYHRKVLPGSFCTDLGLFTFWPLTIMYDLFLPFLDMFRFCILWLFFHAKLSYNQSSQCVSGRFGTFFSFFFQQKTTVFCITFFHFGTRCDFGLYQSFSS